MFVQHVAHVHCPRGVRLNYAPLRTHAHPYAPLRTLIKKHIKHLSEHFKKFQNLFKNLLSIMVNHELGHFSNIFQKILKVVQNGLKHILSRSKLGCGGVRSGVRKGALA